jgi:hypothetical protein
MNAKDLKEGMLVKNGDSIVKVTYIPSFDKYGECFFSGIVVETKDDFYKDFIGKNFIENWNSAFSYPV